MSFSPQENQNLMKTEEICTDRSRNVPNQTVTYFKLKHWRSLRRYCFELSHWCICNEYCLWHHTVPSREGWYKKILQHKFTFSHPLAVNLNRSFRFKVDRNILWKCKGFPVILHSYHVPWSYSCCAQCLHLAGRPGSRKPLQTSSTSPTLRGTMLRSPLFTWTGELYPPHSKKSPLLCWDFFLTRLSALLKSSFTDPSVAGIMTGHSCSFSQTADTLPIYKPEVRHNGFKLWKCEWDLVHEGLDNTRIISFTCCWVYWFPHDPLTLQASADKVKKKKNHKVVNRGTLRRVKSDSLGFCGRMIHGLRIVLKSTEGTVITSYTHTHIHLLSVRWGQFAFAEGLRQTGNQRHAITIGMRF